MIAVERTRIKICGITRPEEAEWCAAAGADAIGLVFYPPSSRFLELARAMEIAASVPPFVTVVGVFVDQDVEEVRRIATKVPLDLLQLHGNESLDLCRRYAWPFIKGVRMKVGTDVVAMARGFPDSRGLLLDTYKTGREGGTGETFPWKCVPRGLAKPVILAGGLNPDNVGEAVRQVRPFAVDVSSGVESRDRGKDFGKIRRFVAAVREADLQYRQPSRQN